MLNDELLEQITECLMRTRHSGQPDALRIAMLVVAQKVLDEPEWLPGLSDLDRQFFEGVMQAGILTSKKTDGPPQ